MSVPAQGQVLLDTFLEEVALVPAEDLNTARLGLRLSEERRTEFEQRLESTCWTSSPPRPDDPRVQPWSLFLALHPDPNKR